MALYLNSELEKEEIKKHILQQCSILSKIIESNYEKLLEELLVYESFETAKDEIWRSVDCLNNISKEIEDLSYGKIDLMCTIFPVNLPLYSLIIFGIVPGFMTKELIIRPPLLAKGIVENIGKIIGLNKLAPHIKFVEMERHMFSEAYISISDVILFTGRYKNAKVVHEVCPNALFIYNGAGVNPVVITDSADIKQATGKTIEMKIFNSGQDCAGSDVIFVHEKIIENFKKELLNELSNIKIGAYQNRDVKIGSLVKTDHLEMLNDFFKSHSNSLIYGGKIDFQKGIVYPTVFIEDITKIKEFITREFFSPVFYILTYPNNIELKKYFNQKNYSDFAMYVSIFGDVQNDLEIPNSVTIQNKIVNDIERGNNPYGGYGPKANFSSYDNIYNHRPLLISKEISIYLEYRMANQLTTQDLLQGSKQ